MASKRKQRELIPLWRCTACCREMTDGAAMHWLYCPEVTGKMVRVGVAEDEDDWGDETEEDGED